jgi:hypothetical protein
MSHTSQHPEPRLWPHEHRLSDIQAPNSDITGIRLTWSGPGWYGVSSNHISTDPRLLNNVLCYGKNRNSRPVDNGDGSQWFESRQVAQNAFFPGRTLNKNEGGQSSVRRKRSQSKRSRSRVRGRRRSRKNRRGKK